jgi:hypothetical protein
MRLAIDNLKVNTQILKTIHLPRFTEMIKAKRLLVLMGLLLSVWLMLGGRAIASIHEYPEGAGHTMYRSLQTLRESSSSRGHKGQSSEPAWQVVVFKRVQAEQTESVHLRLVGFPGTVVDHPEPLYLMGSQVTWTAPDVLGTAFPFPPNVGEYDVRAALVSLESNAPLILQVPTQAGLTELVVPPFAVKEWRQVMATDPDH